MAAGSAFSHPAIRAMSMTQLADLPFDRCRIRSAKMQSSMTISSAGDEPAIASYEKLGPREDVLQFDIGVGVERTTGG